MGGIYLLPCSPLFTDWLRKKLGTCYTFIESSDLSESDVISPLICYVAVADKESTTHRDWDEFVTARKKMHPALTWLILLGDGEYELEGEDEKFIRAKTSNDVATALVKLFIDREVEKEDNDDRL